jgi:zinc/manganese transport system substrate-binding protein
VIMWGRVAAVIAAGAAVLSSTACSSASSGGSPGSVSVVASTNVYADIVEQIAGKLAGGKVKINSIISDPNADPHSYEANTRSQLAISRADLIIENGGGYDDFMDTMRKSSNAKAQVINVVDLSGKKAQSGGELNEHVWYDFPTVDKLVSRIEQFLVAHDKADTTALHANASAFTEKLRRMEATEARVRAAHAGDGVAITEPVPLYLLGACGLVNRTPADFSQAVEEGTEVSPSVLQETLDLFSAHAVALLAYNEQTTGAETEKVLTAAKDNHVAVVAMTETLPAGKTYLTWMQGNLDAIDAALG